MLNIFQTNVCGRYCEEDHTSTQELLERANDKPLSNEEKEVEDDRSHST